MARRKKHQKLPNGYGSIKYLGKGRRNPYGVYPPVTEFDEYGKAVPSRAICYVDEWIKGFAVLTAYKAGTYTMGMEKSLESLNTNDTDILVSRLLADYNRMKGEPEPVQGKTFSDVYKEFYAWKYESGKTYSQASKNSTKAAFLNCSVLHDRIFSELRYNDLQGVVDACTLKYASKELIVSLLNQMFKYADIQEYVDRNHAAHVSINTEDDDEHGEPFTEEDLKVLWKHKNNEVVEFILIMCYSGFRISAYKTLKVHLEDKYFQGGVKTAAGKDRVVPIHSKIYELVNNRLHCSGKLLSESPRAFRKKMYDILEELNIEKHTPHDCRHTFSALCEKYEVNENDRKRMLGHSFGSDITNQVYGHRTLEDLRTEIEKIKICY